MTRVVSAILNLPLPAVAGGAAFALIYASQEWGGAALAGAVAAFLMAAVTARLGYLYGYRAATHDALSAYRSGYLAGADEALSAVPSPQGREG